MPDLGLKAWEKRLEVEPSTEGKTEAHYFACHHNISSQSIMTVKYGMKKANKALRTNKSIT